MVDKRIFLSKTVKSVNEKYYRSFSIVSAMNYGRVIQNKDYSISDGITNDPASFKDVDLLLLKPEELKDVDTVEKHLKNAKIILSCDADLSELHTKLMEKNEEQAYFKSIVLISKDEFEEFLADDIELKDTRRESEHDTLIEELVEYGGFERELVTKVLKEFKTDELSKKAAGLIDYLKKEKKKQEEQKDKK